MTYALNALLAPIRAAFSTEEMQALVARAYPKETEGSSTNEVSGVILDDEEEAAVAAVSAVAVSKPSASAAPAKAGKAKAAAAAPTGPKADPNAPNDAAKLDVKVGRVLKCEKHPHADKLYLSSIDVGEAEPRQVVSGLALYVPLEAMQNRLVCVLTNLKPTSLQGVRSFAMVLAASNEDHSQVELLDPPADAKVGERVTFAGYPTDASLPELARVSEKALKAITADLRTNDEGVAVYKDVAFTTSAGVVRVASLKNATVA